MALSEEQIRRYARHILLPQVGGAGQEKLLAAEVRVSGEAPLVELAGAYLGAAGVRVDAHSGTGLALERRAGDVAPMRVAVRREGASLLVTSGDCARCVGEPSGPIALESGAIAASLAASECLRLILGLGEPARGWEVRGASVARVDRAPCPHEART